MPFDRLPKSTPFTEIGSICSARPSRSHAAERILSSAIDDTSLLRQTSLLLLLKCTSLSSLSCWRILLIPSTPPSPRTPLSFDERTRELKFVVDSVSSSRSSFCSGVTNNNESNVG